MAPCDDGTLNAWPMQAVCRRLERNQEPQVVWESAWGYLGRRAFVVSAQLPAAERRGSAVAPSLNLRTGTAG